MDIESIRKYAISKEGVTESFPFDETTLVFKVKGKIFMMMNLDGISSICLKCDPERAINLREGYSFIESGGCHMSKRTWNHIDISAAGATDTFISELIDHSYQLVVAGLPKIIRESMSYYKNSK